MTDRRFAAVSSVKPAWHQNAVAQKEDIDLRSNLHLQT